MCGGDAFTHISTHTQRKTQSRPNGPHIQPSIPCVCCVEQMRSPSERMRERSQLIGSRWSAGSRGSRYFIKCGLNMLLRMEMTRGRDVICVHVCLRICAYMCIKPPLCGILGEDFTIKTLLLTQLRKIKGFLIRQMH